ncbi:MAG: hypothetical protein IJE07_03860 [Clostridia bacterium]|nr:hypothetical protein [Clostridia bacterium]
MSAAELWWCQVPAGVSLYNQLACDLQQGKSIVLDAGRMPWPDTLRGYLRDVVTQINNAMPFEIINASDCPPGMEPDAFLFRCIGEEDHYGTQLLRIKRLRRKPACLWVDGIPQKQYAQWIDMAVELTREPSQMMLILDIPEQVSVPECERLAPEGVWHSRFDVYYFSLMRLSTLQEDERMVEYAATLCTELSGLDPILCDQLCQVPERLMQNPLKVAEQLGCQVNINQAVLRAQMRAFMPLVELCRITVNELLRHQLENALPFSPDKGETVRKSDVERVELTHIIQMANRGRINLPSDLYNLLHNLREIRNHLAHLTMLSNVEIGTLLGGMDSLAEWQ